MTPVAKVAACLVLLSFLAWFFVLLPGERSAYLDAVDYCVTASVGLHDFPVGGEDAFTRRSTMQMAWDTFAGECEDRGNPASGV